MGGLGKTWAAVLTGAFFYLGMPGAGSAQVVAEPALLTAGVPEAEVLEIYAAFPENSYVLGGMVRFPVGLDVDVGGRAGLWINDRGPDTPFVGADVRYGLLSRPLAPGGGQFNLSFDVGIGVSDPGPTLWKIPVGFIAGVGFSLAGGDSEIFVHPRIDLGVSSGDEETDVALLLDVGGVFTIVPPLGAIIAIRFGDGAFNEGKDVAVALGAAWRL